MLVYPARRLFSSPYPAPNLAPSCLVPATRFTSPRFILRSVLCPVQFRFACFVPFQTAFRAALTGRGDQRPSSFVILAREQPSLFVFLLAPVEIPRNFTATEITTGFFRARLTLRKRTTESSNRKQSPETERAIDGRPTPRRAPLSQLFEQKNDRLLFITNLPTLRNFFEWLANGSRSRKNAFSELRLGHRTRR